MLASLMPDSLCYLNWSRPLSGAGSSTGMRAGRLHGSVRMDGIT